VSIKYIIETNNYYTKLKITTINMMDSSYLMMIHFSNQNKIKDKNNTKINNNIIRSCMKSSDSPNKKKSVRFNDEWSTIFKFLYKN